MPANNAFCRTASDIDDQASAGIMSHIVRDAEINEPRFLTARDDLDRMAEGPLRLSYEGLCVVGAAQRIGPHRTHALVRKMPKALSKLAKAFQRALLRGGRQIPFGIQPGRQQDSLLEPIDDVETIVYHTRDE